MLQRNIIPLCRYQSKKLFWDSKTEPGRWGVRLRALAFRTRAAFSSHGFFQPSLEFRHPLPQGFNFWLLASAGPQRR